MHTKDYYKILELPPSATLKEIKVAYRRLAHQYHPDKNNNDRYAAAQFEIIKEAYEVLSNPSKKEYYLQQRWYDQSMAKKQTTATITPVTVLKQLVELDKYVSTLDVHRLDEEGLYDYICNTLSDETIEKLNQFSEADINATIASLVMKSSKPLSWTYIQPLLTRLMNLKATKKTAESIHLRLLYSRRSANWDRYKIWIVLLFTAILCFIIYSIS